MTWLTVVLMLCTVHYSKCNEHSDNKYDEFLFNAFPESILSFPIHTKDIQQQTTQVPDKMECVFACVGVPWCQSVNFQTTTQNNGLHVCELLSTDKNTHPQNMTINDTFTHLSIKTPCEQQPCLNGGTCSLQNNRQEYRCECKTGFDGNNCQNEPITSFSATGTGRTGTIQSYTVSSTGTYLIRAGGARGGTHSYNYGTKPGTYYGGRGATMEGFFQLSSGTVLNIVVGHRGGNSVEVKGGQVTTKTAAQLGLSVEDNAGTGGGGGSFVYTTSNSLLIAAGGGGGASGGYNGVAGQAGTSGTASVGSSTSYAGGSGGSPGACNSGGNYNGGVGAGWNGEGCLRSGTSHGDRGGSRLQGWVGGLAGKMNSGNNGGPAPGAVGGFGGGGGGSEDNGASGGGGGYSGGGSGKASYQAGGGGGSYCSGTSCNGVTGGNQIDNGFVTIKIST